MTWIDINENKPNDHEWVLIAHKNYATPMKAKYHSDGECFEFYTSGGVNWSYIFESEITHWQKLPKLPERIKE